MANHRNVTAVLVIGMLTLLVGGAGIYLGFEADRRPHNGPPVPKQVESGPILYDMRSIRSDPDRIRFEWADIGGAKGYRVTVLSPSDDSLFSSPTLATNAWVIPTELRSRLAAQSVYHWKVTVQLSQGATRASDPASFATQ